MWGNCLKFDGFRDLSLLCGFYRSSVFFSAFSPIWLQEMVEYMVIFYRENQCGFWLVWPGSSLRFLWGDYAVVFMELEF